jgi:two-component system, NtrC family, sensor kinase
MSRAYRVLFLEDDPVDRMAFDRQIRKDSLPWEVSSCATIADARRHLSDAPFDAMVLDYRLTDGTAFDLTDWIPACPAVLVTGAGDEDVAVRALKSGFRDYIVKDSRRNYLKILPSLVSNSIENHRIALALKLTHRQNEQILASIPLILIGLDPQCRITHWNGAAEKSFGLPQSAAFGRGLFECNLSWDRSRVESWLGAPLDAAVTDDLYDLPLDRPDGTVGFLHLCRSRFSVDAPEPGGILLVGEDTTERKWIDNRLREVDKYRSMAQLAAGIAHEVKSPAQYILNNLAFLEESFRLMGPIPAPMSQSPSPDSPGDRTDTHPDMSSESGQILHAIRQSEQGLFGILRLVDAMKEFSHPGSGRKEPVSIPRVVEGAATIFRSIGKGVADIMLETDPDLPAVWCDRGAVGQVILNLLVNAADAVELQNPVREGPGRITLRTVRSDDSLVIEVRDNGGGIPESVRSRIFEPFFTTKELGKGSGMGLAISRTLIEQQGGTLRLGDTSEAGTVFQVVLPLGEPSDLQLVPAAKTSGDIP